ncbi:hypothetical protein VIBNISOn1_450080 [Vibrio nigripulchritudo SOn1]|uniref:Uncharacterized protein n=1 Tax=Vibrio nigripulchritudo SOn1 TaxID=1238450 RepID=A0AAV2VTU6_9VIBR|nr:hypothetical protein [Vibrio nigripulchritudo]CCO48116.1 hypothetical protein VIBNISOn1_450080 [Vibrio nigripulchritudo SOn1]
MKIAFATSLTILFAGFSAPSVFASQISCALLNEGYLQRVGKMVIAKPVALKPNYKSESYSLFSYPGIEISLANAVVVEHSVSKPFVSAFNTIIKRNDEVLVTRSSVREQGEGSMSSHITLRKGNNKLLITCDSIPQ